MEEKILNTSDLAADPLAYQTLTTHAAAIKDAMIAAHEGDVDKG